MNQHLQKILDFIQQNEKLTAEEKDLLIKEAKATDSELNIADFKLERTEKVKRTTAILLEETIEELEQKRKAVVSQNQELKIEASLERVRARAMAMQNSEELKELIGTVFTELTKLDLIMIGSVIMIFEPETNSSRWWMVNSNAPLEPLSFFIQHHQHKPYLEFIKAWKERTLRWEYELEGRIKEEWDEFLFTQTELASVPATVIDGMKTPDRILLSTSFNNFGCVNVGTLEPLTNEQFDILLRFAKVFDLTYTRFNDLQKAEAQAKEAQIQLALERVRARTMAMQHSDELSETAAVLFEQLKHLGESPERIFIGVMNEEEQVIEIWSTQHGGTQTNMTVKATINEPTVMNRMYVSWKAQKKSIVIDLKGEELESYFQFLKGMGAPVIREIFGERRVENIAFFSKGMLGIVTPDLKTQEAIQLYERFAGVFDLTYTRFLDLQKAEAQAREAHIEAALERVRSRTMAMHKSEELQEVSKIIIQQILFLNFPLFGFGIHICQENEPVSTAWIGDPTKGQVPTVLYEHTHDSLSKLMYKGWKEGESLLVKKVEGEELKEHFEYMASITPISSIFETATPPEFIIYHFAYFSHGFFVIAMLSPYEEALTILKRFAKVFEQTYTRFLDLQKAEAQARESQIEAALESVRASSMAMHHSEELEKVVKTLSDKLIDLGLSLDGAFIFFFEKEKRNFHLWIATNHLTAPIKVGIPYAEDIQNNPIIKNLWDAIETGRDIINESYSGKVKDDYFRFVGEYNETTIPEAIRKFHLEAAYWTFSLAAGKNSLVGIDSWSGKLITQEDFEVLKRFANVFEQAYTRFLDLQKAEALARQAETDLINLKEEKKKTEDALIGLRATQKQLIQSEKMASLGELTAGIAHEIQNPLNFVNNFSEVSSELIAEMKDELQKGNYEGVSAIADDVIQNLEKINHHGKRADAIVKGMLQHSRASTDKKEPTDINALTDEYLRLSYHGLRAKDKSFNAKIQTDFDESIEKINIIPQDIGRVILNLLTNAFYAVSEKKKQQSAIGGYEPTVSISTKKFDDKLTIKVTDNGNGIPQKVLDKIFQPFFTTKPTGQGTGLGLSLSYDIIKAHGGEIKVETKEGERTTFIIDLPKKS